MDNSGGFPLNWRRRRKNRVKQKTQIFTRPFYERPEFSIYFKEVCNSCLDKIFSLANPPFGTPSPPRHKIPIVAFWWRLQRTVNPSPAHTQEAVPVWPSASPWPPLLCGSGHRSGRTARPVHSLRPVFLCIPKAIGCRTVPPGSGGERGWYIQLSGFWVLI